MDEHKKSNGQVINEDYAKDGEHNGVVFTEGESNDNNTEDTAYRENLPDTGSPVVEDELTLKEKALEEMQNRYLRLQADFDNYRKRMRREQEEFSRIVITGLVTSMLPIMDNMERALAAAEADKNSLITGVEMTLRQLKEILGCEGLTPVVALGQPFDPELHEAVSREETTDPEKINKVVEEYRQGYTLKGKLLRPAMVKVAVAPETENEGTNPDTREQGVDK